MAVISLLTLQPISTRMNTTSSRFSKTATLTASAVLLSSTSLFAAEGDTSVLQRYVLDGGWPMILIGLLILALIALCVFNYMNLGKA